MSSSYNTLSSQEQVLILHEHVTTHAQRHACVTGFRHSSARLILFSCKEERCFKMIYNSFSSCTGNIFGSCTSTVMHVQHFITMCRKRSPCAGRVLSLRTGSSTMHDLQVFVMCMASLFLSLYPFRNSISACTDKRF